MNDEKLLHEAQEDFLISEDHSLPHGVRQCYAQSSIAASLIVIARNLLPIVSGEPVKPKLPKPNPTQEV